ncbi:uncharacterized protein LOC115629714 [Scaptodrosophila lebanonensis]|uniref:Uncharacterized protein LOC115629714 n=1 Tax=Drosophila lebanonensis TaxID=7225 RepID=A0A6J2U160_DROLE|nr:uncharacterized protein LOC115629714 [Scaptodrosophila lebanonensis]
MMETFLVLGLCFILYEALDFFQGCIHSNTPSPSDQIEAYRRELDEQRQQQQQEQFLANFTPLLGAQFAAAAAAAAAGSSSSLTSTTPTASTASVISDSYEQHSQSQSQSQTTSYSQQQPHSLSTPGLFRTALGGYQSCYDPEDPLHATSSLPRDYYYLQQQQLKNKASSKSLLSKFSSTNSDNRIYPEAAHGVLGLPASAVITTQPLPVGEAASLFDCQPPAPLVPASPLIVELKRAIISSSQSRAQTHSQQRASSSSSSGCDVDIEDDDEAPEDDDVCCGSDSNSNSDSFACPASSEPNICTASRNSRHNYAHLRANAQLPRIHHIAIDDIGIGGISGRQESTGGGSELSGGISLAANSHADIREIECERLRRKCVSVKRIYSISEKF